jgi:hypothetical protein
LQLACARFGLLLDAVEMDPIVILGPVNDEAEVIFAGFGASYTTFLGGRNR